MKTNRRWIACLYFLICLAAFAQKADSTKQEKILFQVPHFNEFEIKIDGRMDEAVWEKALMLEANIEVRPAENVPAPVMTQAYIFHNQNHFYVGFKAYDPDPSQIRAHYCDRDQIWDDDWVLILFDTFNDQRRTYDFVCNPFGIQADIIETPTGGGGSWDAIWESNGQITDDGYVVEMAIPFSSLGFQRVDGKQTWGFDVVRSYPRNVRHHIGSFHRDRSNNCYMCQSNKLVGFDGATPGRNVEFDPTFSSVYTQERKNETSGPFVEKDKNNDFGLSARWGITPNMNLNATLNPDFNNIEADVLQLDINNQFAIYYPEKRPFFLEGADFFRTPFNIVHTRTLADPTWGAKVTGKEGPHGLGYFTVQDDMTNFLFPGAEGSNSESIKNKSLGSVLRYKHDIGEKSNLGLLMTDREGDAYHNRVAGIDGDFKFTKSDRLMFQVVSSNTQYPDSIAADYDQKSEAFDGLATSVWYQHGTENYEVYTIYRQVDKDFRADLGFMTQAGYRYSETGASYRWRADGEHWYNWLSVYSSYDHREDMDGNVLHKAYTFRWNFEGKKQSHAHVYTEIGRDRFDGQEFRANWIQGCTGLKPWASLFVHLYAKYGDQIDYDNTRAGTRFQINPSLEWYLGKHIKLECAHTYEHLDVDAGRLYTANITRFKLIYQFNKRMFLRTILNYRNYDREVQYYLDQEDVDAKTEKLFSQILFSYKINPQTVFFLGYADDYYGDHETSIIQTNRTFFTKLGYAYRL